MCLDYSHLWPIIIWLLLWNLHRFGWKQVAKRHFWVLAWIIPSIDPFCQLSWGHLYYPLWWYEFYKFALILHSKWSFIALVPMSLLWIIIQLILLILKQLLCILSCWQFFVRLLLRCFWSIDSIILDSIDWTYNVVSKKLLIVHIAKILCHVFRL